MIVGGIMSERISPQQIELINELCQQQNQEPPHNLHDFDVKQAIELLKNLRTQAHHPVNMNFGGFDNVPNFNY
jgi:hypothetical protein